MIIIIRKCISNNNNNNTNNKRKTPIKCVGKYCKKVKKKLKKVEKTVCLLQARPFYNIIEL